ncbi:MAG: hypothetical protein IKX31_00195, partial [Muribaculaceae bacterium]|nr:hypothetical protein [Muribaculaceae bacterium]
DFLIANISMISGLRPPHPFGRASKKPLNSERGPREPKSDAKLQPIFHTAKYLRGFFREKTKI